MLKSKIKYDTAHDKIIEIELAKPFKMLSACFTTIATIIPPTA